MTVNVKKSDVADAAPDIDWGRRVLVVDDSAVQRRLLTAILRRRGYDVFEVASGMEALDLMAGQPIDFVISDWMMPGMTGPELCEAMRAQQSESYAYFILLTTKAEREDVAEGLERGADDFLSKPVNVSELSARLKAGARILSMHQAMAEKNVQLSEALGRLNEAQEAMNRDLADARHLQQSLVPERQRAVLGGVVSLHLRPSGAVGGDLVGSFRVNDTRLGLFAIDVAGHGIASALMTARLAGNLTSSSPEQNIALTIDDMGLYSMQPPPDVCTLLNNMVLEDMTTDLYFTMLIGECNLKTGKIELAQAGHPAPVIQRQGGAIEFVGQGGLPVGLVPGADYQSFSVKLEPGDRILFYSDGVTEAEDKAGAQLDEEGFCRILTSVAELSGTDCLDKIVSYLVEFAGTDDFTDDVSIAMFEYAGL